MLIHERETPFGKITVEDLDHDVRGIFVDGVSQGRMNLVLKSPVSWYMVEMAHRFFSYRLSGLKRGLVIGGGAGILTTALEYSGIETDTIEISADMINVAQEYFGFDPVGRVIHGDAHKVVTTLEPDYDVVILDIYNGNQSTANEWLFNKAADLVRPRGYFLTNGLTDDKHYISELTYDR